MDDTTAPEEFESLHKTNEVLFRKNKALRMKSKYLTRDKEVLQKRLKDLVGQDTSSVPKTTVTDEKDSQEQSTTPGDCESFRQANKFLIQKNKALCIKNGSMVGHIEALQKNINDLISQKTRVTSSVSEISKDTEFADKYSQNQIPKMDEETESEAVHSFDELQKFNVWCERTCMLEEQLQSLEGSCFGEEQNFCSEPNRLLSLTRFVRFFFPGWRRRYSSRETVEYMEVGERPKEDTQRRLTWRERLCHFKRRMWKMRE